jgi:hypothetical protein
MYERAGTLVVAFSITARFKILFFIIDNVLRCRFKSVLATLAFVLYKFAIEYLTSLQRHAILILPLQLLGNKREVSC